MKILIVAATEQELLPSKEYTFKTHSVEFLVMGVGMVATTYALSKQLQNRKYDLAINIGIAGCFEDAITLGTTFQITSDCFSELGAEDKDGFISIDKLGFGKSTYFNSYTISSLPTASSVSVNTVHGNLNSIKNIQKRLSPLLESMEGAAFAFVCEQENQKYLQIRSISNYVEERNKANWEIATAIQNVNTELIKTIKAL